MAHTRLIHDTARSLATATVRVFANLLRDEEKIEAFREVYEISKSHLEQFVAVQVRQKNRLLGIAPEMPPLPDDRDTEVKGGHRDPC